MKVRCRCSECRKRFEPSPTARETQKTCCLACRLKRRRRMAIRRRKKDLKDNRADERERQRKHRAQEREQREKGKKEVIQSPVSRTGLNWDEAILRAEIVEKWDKEMAMSRARFDRQIGQLLDWAVKEVGQAGTENNRCHEPA